MLMMLLLIAISLCARAMVRLVGVYLVGQRIGLRDVAEEAVEFG